MFSILMISMSCHAVRKWPGARFLLESASNSDACDSRNVMERERPKMFCAAGAKTGSSKLLQRSGTAGGCQKEAGTPL
jgi:hypothetical protein